MDVNVLLEELRRMANESVSDVDIRAFQVKFCDLDEWLSKGGFPPEPWRRADTWVCDE